MSVCLDRSEASAKRQINVAPNVPTRIIGHYPVQIPSWCPSTKSEVYHLTAACGLADYIAIFYDVKTKAVTGTLQWVLTYYSQWSTTTTDVLDEFDYFPAAVTGIGKGPYTTGGGGTYCVLTSPSGIQCNQTGAQFALATFTANYPYENLHIEDYRTYNMKANSGSESLIGHFSYERMTYSGTARVINPSYELGTNKEFVTYCDRNFPGRTTAGCKAPTDRYTPTLSYSKTAPYPFIARAIGDAQRLGVPGSPASGHYLSRMTGQANIDANRGVACKSSYTRPPGGYDCDEYPFASTYQGAAFNPTAGITFSYCQFPYLPTNKPNPKWYACFLPSGQNQGAGRALNSFFSANRTLDNDRFYVQVTP